MWRVVFISLFLLISSLNVVRARTVISVDNQSNFDNLATALRKAITGNEDEIYVVFSPGNYEFNNNQVLLRGFSASQKKIHFVGNGAVIVPQGKSYRNGDLYEGEFTVNNCWMSNEKSIETWSRVDYVEGLIEIIDVEREKCRLKYRDSFIHYLDISNAYIQIPHWYQSSIYKIDRIEGGYIYFTVSGLAISYNKGYNINDDYNYGKKRIRYRLCNVETGDDYLRIIEGKVKLPHGVPSIREGNSHTVLNLQNCVFREIEIAGMSFWGNSFANQTPLINIKGTICEEFRVHDCEFKGIRSNVITISNSPNVTIEKNGFCDCYYYGIQSDNLSCNTVIEGNSFNRMGKRVQNTFCVVCQGENFRVCDNHFTDYGFGGVSIGLWYGHNQSKECTGIVERNDFSFTESYLANIMNYGLMDSGAIYLCTRNNGTTIRYNYIHGFSGAGDNRGIFCDDGASNFQIYGNIITGIVNSYCIDSRRVLSLEAKLADIERTNVNNVIKDNIVDGSIRFVGHEDEDDGCEYSTNYLLVNNSESIPKVIVNQVRITGKDVQLYHTGEKRGRIGLSRASYKALKKNPQWEKVKGLFVRKNR